MPLFLLFSFDGLLFHPDGLGPVARIGVDGELHAVGKIGVGQQDADVGAVGVVFRGIVLVVQQSVRVPSAFWRVSSSTRAMVWTVSLPSLSRPFFNSSARLRYLPLFDSQQLSMPKGSCGWREKADGSLALTVDTRAQLTGWTTPAATGL